MTTRDFCYWLRGYFEINGIEDEDIPSYHTVVIKEHLDKVFNPIPVDLKFDSQRGWVEVEYKDNLVSISYPAISC